MVRDIPLLSFWPLYLNRALSLFKTIVLDVRIIYYVPEQIFYPLIPLNSCDDVPFLFFCVELYRKGLY